MLITWKRSLETKNFLSLFLNAMRYNAKVPVGDLWDYVSNTECLTKDCVTQYIIKWDGKRWVADTLCDPDCPDIEQMLENYYTKEEVNNIINQIEDHDTTYQAGDYITITGPTNIISADIEAIKEAVDTDTTYTAGDYINISNTNVISADIEALKEAIDTDTTYTAGDHITISSTNVISANLDEYPTRTEIQNNYYNKTQVDELIAAIEDHDTTYTAGVANEIVGANNTINVKFDNETIKVNGNNELYTDLSNYYNKQEIINNYYDKPTIDEMINQIEDHDTTYEAGNYITITGPNNTISADIEAIKDAVDTDTTYTAGDYINISSSNVISADIEALKDAIDTDTKYTAGDHITISSDNVISADLSNYYNKDDIHNNYYNKTTIDEMLAAIEDHDTTYTAGIANEITGANNTINVKYDNDTIKVNASNELYTDLSNYYNKQEVNELISSITPGGEPIIYTAGDNVQISPDHVISATDTTYTAGTNVQISADNVISATDTTYTAGEHITIDANNVISADFSDIDVDNVPKFDSAFARITLNGTTVTFSNAFITNETMATYVITNNKTPAGIITMTVDTGSITISSTEAEDNIVFLVKLDKMNSDSIILTA